MNNSEQNKLLEIIQYVLIGVLFIVIEFTIYVVRIYFNN